MLPGVDDGSDSMDTSLLMASMAAESGVETVIVTPHCNIPGEAANYPSRELLGRFMALRETIDAAKIPLRAMLRSDQTNARQTQICVIQEALSRTQTQSSCSIGKRYMTRTVAPRHLLKSL